MCTTWLSLEHENNILTEHLTVRGQLSNCDSSTFLCRYSLLGIRAHHTCIQLFHHCYISSNTIQMFQDQLVNLFFYSYKKSTYKALLRSFFNFNIFSYDTSSFFRFCKIPQYLRSAMDCWLCNRYNTSMLKMYTQYTMCTYNKAMTTLESWVLQAFSAFTLVIATGQQCLLQEKSCFKKLTIVWWPSLTVEKFAHLTKKIWHIPLLHWPRSPSRLLYS